MSEFETKSTTPSWQIHPMHQSSQPIPTDDPQQSLSFIFACKQSSMFISNFARGHIPSHCIILVFVGEVGLKAIFEEHKTIAILDNRWRVKQYDNLTPIATCHELQL
jgi:hypothetical protein